MNEVRERVSFVVIAEAGVRHLAPTLRRLFSHPWVASYQIGFGPPLVRSSERLITRVREAKGVMDKLEAYVDACLLNEDERRRLLGIFRRITVRAQGALDVEALDEASAQVLDLSLRLHHPAFAPPAASASMRARGVPIDVLPLKSEPEALTGTLFVRLADPRGERLFHHDLVRARAFDVEHDLGIELRVPPKVRGTFDKFLEELESAAPGLRHVDIGEPMSHARVKKDGVAS